MADYLIIPNITKDNVKNTVAEISTKPRTPLDDFISDFHASKGLPYMTSQFLTQREIVDFLDTSIGKNAVICKINSDGTINFKDAVYGANVQSYLHVNSGDNTVTSIDAMLYPDWQPLSDTEGNPNVIMSKHYRSKDPSRTGDYDILVMQLKNGLFFAVLEQYGSKHVVPLNDEIKLFPDLPKNYHLRNLSETLNEQDKGFSATFEYGGKETKDGGIGDRIEYTTWHNPKHDLIIITNLHAIQKVEEGYLELKLDVDSHELTGRFLKTTMISPGAQMVFDGLGNLQTAQFGIEEEIGLKDYHLKDVYRNIKSGIEIDALRTAEALVKNFPSERLFHIEKIVQYR